jgi:protein-S-isoprenylcysteine O-methyltransferase Ste14
MKRFATTARLIDDSGTLDARPGLIGRPRDEARPSLDRGELAARMAIVAMFTLLAVRFGTDFIQTGRMTGLLLLASEALVVVFTVCRRPTGVVDRTVRARILTTVSMMGPLFFGPSAGGALLSEPVTVAIVAGGLLIVIAGKLSLGRSFGLMPANRGVVSTGLYRIVRHPIYLGYLFTHVGVVAANPTTWNVMLLVAADIALLARAACEERTLALDPAYREYREQVRWRVIPGVF